MSKKDSKGKPVLWRAASITDQVIYSARPGIQASIVINKSKKHDTQPNMVDIVHLGDACLL